MHLHAIYLSGKDTAVISQNNEIGNEGRVGGEQVGRYPSVISIDGSRLHGARLTRLVGFGPDIFTGKHTVPTGTIPMIVSEPPSWFYLGHSIYTRSMIST